mmetsp:Transcript_109489/g.320468  ORF Transcript_109489/g.320468 Transcript_109489/m.320468 type:complete len:261 (-) Transcript_109489:299-1081(-)
MRRRSTWPLVRPSSLRMSSSAPGHSTGDSQAMVTDIDAVGTMELGGLLWTCSESRPRRASLSCRSSEASIGWPPVHTQAVASGLLGVTTAHTSPESSCFPASSMEANCGRKGHCTAARTAGRSAGPAPEARSDTFSSTARGGRRSAQRRASTRLGRSRQAACGAEAARAGSGVASPASGSAAEALARDQLWKSKKSPRSGSAGEQATSKPCSWNGPDLNSLSSPRLPSAVGAKKRKGTTKDPLPKTLARKLLLSPSPSVT